MQAHIVRRKKIIGVSLMMVLPLFALDAAVILNDTFADNERVTQNLPASANWLSARATADANVTGGYLRFDNFGNNRAGGLAYLSDPGDYVDMGIGGTLTLTFNYRYGANNADEGGLYFGLINTGGTRVSSDNHDYNNSAFGNDVGYVGVGVFGDDTSSGRFRVRERVAGVNNYASLGPGSTAMPSLVNTVQAGGDTANEWYQARLVLNYVSPSQMNISATIDGQTISVSDTSSIITSFDQVYIMSGQKPISFLDIDNINVTYLSNIPEPGTIGFLAFGAYIIAILRRQFLFR